MAVKHGNGLVGNKRENRGILQEKYAETGILHIFRKNHIIYHLKLNEEEAKSVRHALTTLLKEGKIVKYGRQTYRWYGI